jgi:hypothetical protein
MYSQRRAKEMTQEYDAALLDVGYTLIHYTSGADKVVKEMK